MAVTDNLPLLDSDVGSKQLQESYYAHNHHTCFYVHTGRGSNSNVWIGRLNLLLPELVGEELMTPGLAV